MIEPSSSSITHGPDGDSIIATNLPAQVAAVECCAKVKEKGKGPEAELPLVPRIYRLLDQVPLLRRAFAERGWVELHDGLHQDSWSISWKGTRFLPSEYQAAAPTQLLNHFIGSAKVTRKDCLLRTLRKLRAVHGPVYGIYPEGFLLPTEYLKFIQEYSKLGTESIWICKPTDSSRGRKIFLLRDLKDLTYDQPFLIQKYLERPLTVGGYKFDLRLYMAVTRVHPLEMYLYCSDGLVRFGTDKYPHDPRASDLQNLYSHLTNSSINKHSSRAGEDKDVIGPGCKWSLRTLKAWVETQHPNGREMYRILWGRIVNIIVLASFTLLTTVPPAQQQAFELFGLDVMVDADWRPWLLEINSSPSLYQDCDVDEDIKLPLLRDLIELLEGDIAQGQAQLQERQSSPLNHHSNCGTPTQPHHHSSISSSSSSSSSRKEKSLAGQGSSSAFGSTRSVGGAGAALEEGAAWDPQHRCLVGGWERIFPISQSSFEASRGLTREMMKKSPASDVEQKCFRTMVAEVRAREKRLREEAKAAKAVHHKEQQKNKKPNEARLVETDDHEGLSSGAGYQAARQLQKVR